MVPYYGRYNGPRASAPYITLARCEQWSHDVMCSCWDIGLDDPRSVRRANIVRLQEPSEGPQKQCQILTKPQTFNLLTRKDISHCCSHPAHASSYLSKALHATQLSKNFQINKPSYLPHSNRYLQDIMHNYTGSDGWRYLLPLRVSGLMQDTATKDRHAMQA